MKNQGELFHKSNWVFRVLSAITVYVLMTKIGSQFNGPLWFSALGAVAWVWLESYFQLDEVDDKNIFSISSLSQKSTLWGTVLFICFFALIFSSVEIRIKKTALVWLVMFPVALSFIQAMVRVLFAYYRKIFGRNTVFFGWNESSKKIYERIQSHSGYCVKAIGVFDDRSAERLELPSKVNRIGTFDKLWQSFNELKISKVIFSMSVHDSPKFNSFLEKLRVFPVSLYYAPNWDRDKLVGQGIGEIAQQSVFILRDSPIFGVGGAFKRLFDILFSLLILVVGAPIWALIAVLVKITSPGPVFFKQKRYGLNGESIEIYKFRTLKVHDNGFVQVKSGDHRVTPLGLFLRKSSIDEIPQFFNVLQGRMSVVGPRPHAIEMDDEYRKSVGPYMFRYYVKPGITGWAQINGLRGPTTQSTIKKRIQYDLRYIQEWSLFWDILIVFLTPLVLIRGKNAI